MRRRILLINGNPKKQSFSGDLTEKYRLAAQESHDVRVHQLAEMDFDPDLKVGYDTGQVLEADLVDFQASIKWANHIVIITPIWWGGLPAKFKGVFDRTFLPEFAFKYLEGKSVPEKLLKNKSARIVMLMDTPPWYYRYLQGAPALKQLKDMTLKFSGFANIRDTMIGPIIGSNETQQTKWKGQVQALGAKGR